MMVAYICPLAPALAVFGFQGNRNWLSLNDPKGQ